MFLEPPPGHLAAIAALDAAEGIDQILNRFPGARHRLLKALEESVNEVPVDRHSLIEPFVQDPHKGGCAEVGIGGQ